VAHGCAVAAIAALLAGCTVTSGTSNPSLAPSRPATSSTASSATGSATGGSGPTAPASGFGGSGTAGAQACPAAYRPPDPHRPAVRLVFHVSTDLTTVRGTEHIAFTPDRPITQLVFRLTANTLPTVRAGNKIVVTSARADHGAQKYTFTRAGAAASTQGGLLHIPFATTIPAGTTVTADIAFTITLGSQSFDRFGRTDNAGKRFAWFGSAQPLLAWQRGYGWHTEDMVQFPAESATSEAMRTDLTVTAPAADTVIMSGDPDEPTASGAMRTWHAVISAARDVSVAIGPFSVSDTTVNGVRLRLGAYSSAIRDALVPEFHRALTQLAKRFGPYPFRSLSVARLPAGGGGIEYPSSILMLDGSRLVAVHETAHQWFYAMVGDSQALHPWLDEAFAQYAQQLVDGTPERPSSLAAPGRVDSSTESYGANMNAYYFTTYNKGAAALEAARKAVGAAKWDAALRCYINANAWRIATPGDLAAALTHLPKALAVLREAGALP
jgi:aminopeptidase N